MEEEKKIIYPMGYARSESGRTVGIIFGLFSVILTVIMLVSGGHIIEAAPFIFMAAAFFIGGFAADISQNSRSAKLNANMEELMKGICVSGKITGGKVFYSFFGRYCEVKSDAHYKAHSLAYDFTVCFEDPYTGEWREVTTEKYSYFVLHEKLEGKLRMATCYDKETAFVYCAPDERVWVGMLYRDPNETDQ